MSKTLEFEPIRSLKLASILMNLILCFYKYLFLPQSVQQQRCKTILKEAIYILLPEFNVFLYPMLPVLASDTVHKPQICEASILIVNYLILFFFLNQLPRLKNYFKLRHENRETDEG